MAGRLPWADVLRRGEHAIRYGSLGADRTKGKFEPGPAIFLPLKLDEVNLIATVAPKVNEVRCVPFVDRKTAGDQERKNVRLQRSSQLRGLAHALVFSVNR